MFVGCIDGEAEGLADGTFDAVTVGLDDGTEDLSTQTRLPNKSSSFNDQQHLATSQMLVFFEFMKHSEMKSAQISL